MDPIGQWGLVVFVEEGGGVNRLANEKSPYLLQHARNPVEWYPWGPEALARARKEDKPVFLSIGYSTCHWCHVMERESFESRDVAGILNRDFVAVKVDREERPDLDETYMLATHLMNGRGGWPNSVWLRPDGKPWYAGTYFPREDRGNLPGLKTILEALARTWKERRADVDRQAEQLWAAMQEAAGGFRSKASGDLDRGIVEEAIGNLAESFDRIPGGFGGAPKFPPHAALALLLHEAGSGTPGPEDCLEMALGTLDAIAAGGIHDQVGGGFHRYSTDGKWFVPHFEKMLYDNAQLCSSYVHAWRLTGKQVYADTARGAFGWVLREMTAEEGGFYSALDADSEGVEGRFYVWETGELEAALGVDEARAFGKAYGVCPEGNWRDEATGRRSGTNILHLPEAADGKEASRFAATRARLLEVRNRRPRPYLDDKLLAAWNGLMIGALACGARHLEEPEYLRAAQRAAGFVIERMTDGGDLKRTFRDGAAGVSAYAEDYAFMARGLLELYEADGNRAWLKTAEQFTKKLLDDYRDSDGAFYFTPANGDGPGLRTRDPVDRAVPSSNGVAAQVLVRLAAATGNEDYLRAARRTLDAYAPMLRSVPSGAPSLVLAAAMYFDAAAKGPVAGGTRVRRRPATLDIRAEGSGCAPGQEFVLIVAVSLDSSYHVSTDSPCARHLEPTSLSLLGPKGFSLAGAAFPPGELAEFGGEQLSVLAGDFEVEVRVAVHATVRPGRHALQLRFAFQACSDRECLQPDAVELTVPIQVVEPS